MSTWYGWAWHGGQWHRVCGPHPDRDSAARALDAEVSRRGWRVPTMYGWLTGGAPPRRQPPTIGEIQGNWADSDQ
jgi:hypothetical protein